MGQTIYRIKSNVKNPGDSPTRFLKRPSGNRCPPVPRAFLVESVHEASQAETPGIELRHSGGLPLRPAIQRPAAGTDARRGGGKTYLLTSASRKRYLCANQWTPGRVRRSRGASASLRPSSKARPTPSSSKTSK